MAQQEEVSDEDDDIPSEFISRRELEKGRLSRDEIKRMSVFKNYEPGEPTCRLYVKNIAKQVEEKDLKNIYGRYIDIASEAERNMFDVILMKEGRMKGQAFVGLPNEKSAEKALRDTNGYVLHDKPLVVQFARSAKPKQDTNDPKKGQKKR
uniref:RNA-binding region-containing protein 3 n=1 Tax=Anguilla anguilla TaxID=7936 RepID=A0A0E9WTK7_ANGAN